MIKKYIKKLFIREFSRFVSELKNNDSKEYHLFSKIVRDEFDKYIASLSSEKKEEHRSISIDILRAALRELYWIEYYENLEGATKSIKAILKDPEC